MKGLKSQKLIGGIHLLVIKVIVISFSPFSHILLYFLQTTLGGLEIIIKL